MKDLSYLLKKGNIVQYRDGRYRLVVDQALVGIDGYVRSDVYGKDLICKFRHKTNLDIIKVFKLNYSIRDYDNISKCNYPIEIQNSMQRFWFDRLIKLIKTSHFRVTLLYERDPIKISIF